LDREKDYEWKPTARRKFIKVPRKGGQQERRGENLGGDIEEKELYGEGRIEVVTIFKRSEMGYKEKKNQGSTFLMKKREKSHSSERGGAFNFEGKRIKIKTRAAGDKGKSTKNHKDDLTFGKKERNDRGEQRLSQLTKELL